MPESLERGALTEAVFYILLSLHVPLHGYGIMQFVSKISEERVSLGPGTLYGALHTLQKKGWIEGLNLEDPRKKEYQITQEGRRVLENELHRLETLLSHGKQILGG